MLGEGWKELPVYAAVGPRPPADEEPQEERDSLRHDANAQGNPGAVKKPSEEIPAQGIGAKGMRRAGRGRRDHACRDHRVVRVLSQEMRESGSEDRRQGEENHDSESDAAHASRERHRRSLYHTGSFLATLAAALTCVDQRVSFATHPAGG